MRLYAEMGVSSSKHIHIQRKGHEACWVEAEYEIEKGEADDKARRRQKLNGGVYVSEATLSPAPTHFLM